MPLFPLLQGADGYIYLTRQVLTTAWKFGELIDSYENYEDTEEDSEATSMSDLPARPAFPVAAFPSWTPPPPPTGMTRVGDGCDGFFCHNLLDADQHRGVVECFDALLEAQGESVVPQYTMVIDPNMHLAEARAPGSGTHKLPEGEEEYAPTVCWAATPFAVLPNDAGSGVEAMRLGPINALEEPGGVGLEEQTGRLFETVLGAAAPMLAALRRPSLLLPGPLQAVCKAQRIFLRRGEV
jgi:hypothetical protein